MVSTARARTYSVYVVRLRKEVLAHKAFTQRNPEHRPDKPCVYVGSTFLAPLDRYRQHQQGINSSKWVHQFHESLHEKLTRNQPQFATRQEAEQHEYMLALRLRRRGYAVWTNLPAIPRLYKETHFRAKGWSDAPKEFAIITAYAPTGEEWSDAKNKESDARLARTFHKCGIWMRRITGYSPNSGHGEPGWAIALPFDQACDVGRKYKQDAIYYVSDGRLSVSFCDSRRVRRSVGIFDERLHTY